MDPGHYLVFQLPKARGNFKLPGVSSQIKTLVIVVGFRLKGIDKRNCLGNLTWVVVAWSLPEKRITVYRVWARGLGLGAQTCLLVLTVIQRLVTLGESCCIF